MSKEPMSAEDQKIVDGVVKELEMMWGFFSSQNPSLAEVGKEEEGQLACVPEAVKQLWAQSAAIGGLCRGETRALVAGLLRMVDGEDVPEPGGACAPGSFDPHTYMALDREIHGVLNRALGIGPMVSMSRRVREAVRVECGFVEPQPPTWVTPGAYVWCPYDEAYGVNRRIVDVAKGPAAHVVLARPDGQESDAEVIPMGMFLWNARYVERSPKCGVAGLPCAVCKAVLHAEDRGPDYKEPFTCRGCQPPENEHVAALRDVVMRLDMVNGKLDLAVGDRRVSLSEDEGTERRWAVAFTTRPPDFSNGVKHFFDTKAQAVAQWCSWVYQAGKGAPKCTVLIRLLPSQDAPYTYGASVVAKSDLSPLAGLDALRSVSEVVGRLMASFVGGATESTLDDGAPASTNPEQRLASTLEQTLRAQSALLAGCVLPRNMYLDYAPIPSMGCAVGGIASAETPPTSKPRAKPSIQVMFGGVSFIAPTILIGRVSEREGIVRVDLLLDDDAGSGVNSPEVIATLRRMAAAGDPAQLELRDEGRRKDLVRAIEGHRGDPAGFEGPEPSLVFIPVSVGGSPLSLTLHTLPAKGR